MHKATLPAFALVFAGLAVGCSWTCHIAIYRIWTLIPAASFAAYQDAHALHFVPVALLFGAPSLVLALLLARRGLANVPRSALWAAVALAAAPWVATPVYFLPLQAQLHAAGPTPELVGQLVNADLVLRTLPPTIQLAILGGALLRSLKAVL